MVPYFCFVLAAHEPVSDLDALDLDIAIQVNLNRKPVFVLSCSSLCLKRDRNPVGKCEATLAGPWQRDRPANAVTSLPKCQPNFPPIIFATSRVNHQHPKLPVHS